MESNIGQTRNLKNTFSCVRMNVFREHGELIAALFSGLLILFTWSFKGYLSPSAWIILHLAAFGIGGFAKAKEGIEETIANRELNVEMLMIFAAIGSAAIGYWTEGAILIFIFALSGALETYTMNKNNKEVSSLMRLQPEEATRIMDGVEETIPVKLLKVGDYVSVRASERIPADGKIVKGSTSIDESAITGESLPVEGNIGAEVFAGTVALDGSIAIEITKPQDETLFQKIIQMVQHAQAEKPPSQLFIEKFEGKYVKVVLAVVLVMMFLPYFLLDWAFTDSIYRAMILLVVASPCALVASIMPATLSAISSSAKRGVLLKGGVHAENMGHIKMIAFDKTGTLTNGKPVVTDVYVGDNEDSADIIAIAGEVEKESTHPLARAITAYSAGHSAQPVHISDVKTISGNGLAARVDHVEWKIGKAAFVGEEAAYHFRDRIGEKLAAEGKTVVFVKKDNKISALFALKDTIRKDIKTTIKTLKKQGIHTVMLTGDNEVTAKAIANEAGIDTYIANCLPEKKAAHIKKFGETYRNVAMVGDGINDAPALASANVGIAMGEGTDVALETADVVLMKNDLSKIIDAIRLSGRMNRVVKQNIFFSLFVITLLIITNFFQLLDLPLGVIGHEGSTILVILNGLRLLK